MKLKGLHLKVGLLAAVLLSMVWGFQILLFQHAPSVFNDPLEDMSFAWYVPVFSLYVLWSERQKIRASIGEPSVVGLVLSVPFLFLGFIGTRGVQVRFEILAFAGLLLTLPWAFFGRRLAKAILFPVGFLLFCIPLATFLDIVTVHLRLLASSVAYACLHGFGADVIRQGTMIGAANGSFVIDVAEPCSGLRSIFALMALTAAYAYFNQPTWLRRGILFASSVPLAVFGNVMRILTICLVANFASKKFATGFYHDYSGYVVFAVAILLMVGFGELLNRIFARFAKPGATPEGEADPAASCPVDVPETKRALLVPVLALALVVPAMCYQAMTPVVTLADPPEVCLGEIPGYTSVEVEASEAERTVLPADTRIVKRQYTSSNGAWFRVSLVIGGASKSSIHRPELCLPAQGFQMKDPRTVRVGETDWRFITLDSKQSAPLGFCYTFVNQEGYRTASHVARILRDVWDRSVLNRIDRWVMITVNASSPSDGMLKAIAEMLGGVVR